MISRVYIVKILTTGSGNVMVGALANHQCWMILERVVGRLDHRIGGKGRSEWYFFPPRSVESHELPEQRLLFVDGSKSNDVAFRGHYDSFRRIGR